MAAAVFDHPVVLLIIAGVALLRWLIQKAKAEGQSTETPTPSQPITRGSETQSEEERIRKFLEALGQPAGTQPPNVTPRRRSVEPQIFPKLPRLTTKPPPLPPPPPQRPMPPPMPSEFTSPRPLTMLEPDFEVHEVARQVSSEPAPAMVRSGALIGRIKLGTPQDLRTAIVLREVFGPPRSLQPIDSLAGF
jgi:hypothetical protein